MATTLTQAVAAVVLVILGILVTWGIYTVIVPENGNGDLGFQLLNVIKNPKKSDNLVMSPLSLSIAMAMLTVGVRGNTSNDIKQAFRFPSDDKLLHQSYQDLLQEVAAVPSTLENHADIKASLVMPNKIFVADTFTVSSDFNETLTSKYGAGAEIVDYTKPKEAAAIINDFVSTSTQDKIKDLISDRDLSDDTKLVLVNAIHFKAKWESTFYKESTSKMPFFAFGTDSKDVDMMHGIFDEVNYGEHSELDAKSISLEYTGISRNRRMFMTIILPNEKDGLAKLENKLKTVPLTQVINAQTIKRVSVKLPKFKIESTIELEEPLKDLGCGSIFTDDADFSGITENNSTQLKVSKVIQKAFIEVNEDGTEAAAATGIVIVNYSGTIYLNEPVPFHVDRPFLAVIVLKVDKDNPKSDITPVFISRVQNPE